jgi:hypothetical protein
LSRRLSSGAAYRLQHGLDRSDNCENRQRSEPLKAVAWNDLSARLPLIQGPFLTTSADKEVVPIPRKTVTLHLLITGEEGRYLRTKDLRSSVHRDVPLAWHDGDL